jgi:hypothetical protein
MARDYKYRAQGNTATSNSHYKPRTADKSSIDPIKWVLMTALAVSCAGFMVYANSMKKQTELLPLAKILTTAELIKAEIDRKKTVVANNKTDQDTLEAPHYDFYKLLPQNEVVIAHQEVKTRSRDTH